MNLIIKIGLSVVALLLLSTTACKKDCEDPTNPECSNYDPCYEQSPLTADIKIEEVIGQFWRFPMAVDYGKFSYETDTACLGTSIVFSTTAEADRYEWRIGSDPRVWEETSFSLEFFRSASDYGFQPVTLMVSLTTYRENPHTCYPEDVMAREVRPVTIVSRADSKMSGNFKGQSTRFPDSTFTISIEIDSSGHSTVYNLPKGCVDLYPFDNVLQVGYRRAAMIRSSLAGKPEFCYAWEGVLSLNESGNELSIDYYLWNNDFFENYLLEQRFSFDGTRL